MSSAGRRRCRSAVPTMLLRSRWHRCSGLASRISGPAQHAWIERQVAELDPTAGVRVVSECLTDTERARWTAAGFDVVFEEIAMESELPDGKPSPEARWPNGSAILEWGDAAAGASFEVYEAAFRGRPGFPGWSRSEWIGRLTGDADFVPEASLCVLRNGAPAGFVVCSRGWIDQVGRRPGAPPHRARQRAGHRGEPTDASDRHSGRSPPRQRQQPGSPRHLAAPRMARVGPAGAVRTHLSTGRA